MRVVGEYWLLSGDLARAGTWTRAADIKVSTGLRLPQRLGPFGWSCKRIELSALLHRIPQEPITNSSILLLAAAAAGNWRKVTERPCPSPTPSLSLSLSLFLFRFDSDIILLLSLANICLAKWLSGCQPWNSHWLQSTRYMYYRWSYSLLDFGWGVSARDL